MVVTRSKKEDKYDIDEVLSFVGEVGNNEKEDSRERQKIRNQVKKS